MTDWFVLPEYLQRLWLVHSMARDKSLLNIGADVVVRGHCPPEAIEAAFTAAVAEHEAFRLRFTLGKAGPECQLLDMPVSEWRVADLGGLGDHGDTIPESVYREVADRESIPLSPETGLLVRATLYQLGRDIAVLAVTAHHLVADAWTIRVLVQDVLHHWRRMQGEEVPTRPKVGRFIDTVSHVPTVTSTGPAACSDRPPFRLPLDRTVEPEERSGRGGEASVQLDAGIYSRFRRRCAEVGQTPFAGLAGTVLTLFARVCDTPSVEAGILVTTRDLRHQRRTAGCFVQAASVCVDLPRGITVSQVIQATGGAVRDTWSRARSGQAGTGRRFPLMISMVRDASARLLGPSGVPVRYERRRRTHAECDLHVFVYEHEDKVEIVFNYDADVLTSATVASWAQSYRDLIERIAECPEVPAVDKDVDVRTHDEVGGLAPMPCRLQHIGLAAWELDIGLRRLASVGIPLQGQTWEDPETGVAMGLAGDPDGVQFEVVAPLRADAPCVGALTRDGEGPYHCCWRVPDTAAMLDAMRHSGVKHTVIRQNGHSGLFPEERITFVLVDGFGLVEFLDGSHFGVAVDKPYRERIGVQIGVYSNDLNNAWRFLHLTRHSRCFPSGGQHDQTTVWLSSDHHHMVTIARSGSCWTPCISHVGYSTPQCSDTAILRPGGEPASPRMPAMWWKRFHPNVQGAPNSPANRSPQDDEKKGLQCI